jgi:integrase
MTPHANDSLNDPFNAQLAAWREQMRSDSYSLETIRGRCDVIAHLHAYTGGEFTEVAVRAYLNSRPLSPWSVITYLNHIRAWAKFLRIVDPTADIRRPRTPEFTPRPVTEPQLRTLLAAADIRTRAWITLGAYAGLRAAETAQLCGEQLFHNGDRWSLHVAAAHAKSKKSAILPLPAIAADALATYQHTTGRLWNVSPKGVTILFSAFAKQAGVPVTYHQLRHRYGTQVYRTGKDLLRTQKLMRHSSPRTTTAYIALDDRYEQAVDMLPGATHPPDDKEQR